jgi:competence protein ComEC
MYFFLSFLAGVALLHAFWYFPFSVILIAIISCSCLLVKKKPSFAALILIGAVFAFLRLHPAGDIPYIKDNVAVKGMFISYPVNTTTGDFRQNFKIDSAMDVNEVELHLLSGKEIALFSDQALEPWVEYGLNIKFHKSRKRLNPGERTDAPISATVSGIYHEGKKKASLYSKVQEYRHSIGSYMKGNFSEDSGALVSSITIGKGAQISEDLREAFNRAGLAHMLSISGTHFGLFSVFLFGIFRLIMQVFPYKVLQRITIFLTPSQAAALLSLPFMIAYLGLSGASIPALRSFIMISLFLFGLVIGKKGFWLNSLLLAAFILVVWEPESLFTLSFLLSFFAVLFIGFSIEAREEVRERNQKEISEGLLLQSNQQEKKAEKGLPRYIKNALLITLSASLGTAPLVAHHFHYFSLISPVSNLLIAPLIGFILIPLSVVSSFIYIFTGHFLFNPIVSGIADAGIAMVKLFSGIPFAGLKVGAMPLAIIFFFYAGFIFYLLFDKRKYLLLIPFIPLLIFLLVSAIDKKDISVTYLDVGQGDSSVIELPDGKILALDTGRTGRETASFLRFRGKSTVDALILSHAHPDHTGGMEYLINRFNVGEIWGNGRLVLPDYTRRINSKPLERGDVIEGKGYKIYVLHPYAEFYPLHGNVFDIENNDSLVLKIEGNHASFLFTGDIQEEAEEDIMHVGNILQSDVIKVPHHGGRTSAFKPFFSSVSPAAAVISAGRGNAFNHPHPETLDALDGIRILRTDRDGAISVKESGNGIAIKTYNDFALTKAGSLNEEVKNIRRLFETW